tara:strand:- start:9 stop:596 length:588 start_codon:yes stop_codon:yes gene_type:complete
MSKNRKELLLEKKTIRRFAQLANVSLNENYLSEQEDEELEMDAADDLEKADELEMDAADDMEAADELEMDAEEDLEAAEKVEVDPVELATAIMDAVEEVVPGVVVDVAPEAEEEVEMEMDVEEELPLPEEEPEMEYEEEEEVEVEEPGRRMYESKRKMNEKMLNEVTDRVYKRLQEMARKQKRAATTRKTRRTKK